MLERKKVTYIIFSVTVLNVTRVFLEEIQFSVYFLQNVDQVSTREWFPPQTNIVIHLVFGLRVSRVLATK